MSTAPVIEALPVEHEPIPLVTHKLGELSLVADIAPRERTPVEAMQYFHDLTKQLGYAPFTIGTFGEDEAGKFIERDGKRYALPS